MMDETTRIALRTLKASRVAMLALEEIAALDSTCPLAAEIAFDALRKMQQEIGAEAAA